MDASTLSYYLELVSGNGCILTVEQRTALQTSLVILKKNYKFQRVLFWGKILGLESDYFIAQGRQENEIAGKIHLYSVNCVDWLLLPAVTDLMVDEVSKVGKGRFTGDPSFVMVENKTHTSEELDEPAEDDTEKIKVSEEKRLAVIIHNIDEEVSVVPRGAFIKGPKGIVQINRSFGGLSESEVKRLENFMHFREPRNINKDLIPEHNDWSPRIDFLDTLDEDIPKGVWSVQLGNAGKVCVLRNLLWLGLTFYHVPMTPQHGYIYIGDGMENLDLPFML